MVLDKDQTLWNGRPLIRGRCSCGMAMTSPHLERVAMWLESHGDPAGRHVGELEQLEDNMFSRSSGNL